MNFAAIQVMQGWLSVYRETEASLQRPTAVLSMTREQLRQACKDRLLYIQLQQLDHQPGYLMQNVTLLMNL